MRVLIAEDDSGLRSVISRGLSERGFIVDAVSNGEEALAYMREYEHEVAILDWRMPKVSGLEVVQEARKRGYKTPILMLTALDATENRVQGLESGADDYLIKPFEFEELVARIRALQRRPPDFRSTLLECGDIELDPAAMTVTQQGKPLAFTGTEFSILELLIRKAPQVVSRRSIAIQVWDDEADAVGSNTIDVHLARLRSKLATSTITIETVRGVGYRIVDRH